MNSVGGGGEVWWRGEEENNPTQMKGLVQLPLFPRASRGFWRSPGVDEHVGDETPRFLPLVGLVRERAVPNALIQGHPLLLRLPHGVVDKHRQLDRRNKHRRLRCAFAGAVAGTRVDGRERLLKDEESGNPKDNRGKKATSHTDTGQRKQESDSNLQASLKEVQMCGFSALTQSSR